uniref:type II toxin-antitoxin system RelE/ParE family toxin n=1 Tax=Flavobacterium sp. TaxID=239 RepID=UPI00404A3095
MSYKIIAIPIFQKELKKLSKKYPSLKNDLAIFFDVLEKKPLQGSPLGKNCFKIRIAITSKGKGKSSGARIITNIVIDDEIIYLLSIYDKSEKENLTDKELIEILKSLEE